MGREMIYPMKETGGVEIALGASEFELKFTVVRCLEQERSWIPGAEMTKLATEESNDVVSWPLPVIERRPN